MWVKSLEPCLISAKYKKLLFQWNLERCNYLYAFSPSPKARGAFRVASVSSHLYPHVWHRAGALQMFAKCK